MTTNLIDKKVLLTTIQDKYLKKLIELDEFIMCDALEDTLLSKDDHLDVDVGYGTLSIKFEDGTLKFRFKPSAKFEEELISTVVNKQNSLKIAIESALVSKLTQTYKDLM